MSIWSNMPTRRHTVDNVHVQLLIRFPLPLTRSRTCMHAGRWWKVGMTPTKVASCDALVTWSDARRLRVRGSAPADAVVMLGLGVIDCGGGWMRRRRAVQCSLAYTAATIISSSSVAASVPHCRSRVHNSSTSVSSNSVA